MDAKIDYPNWKSDMFNLLSDLLPAMTDMIVYFHTNYYDPSTVSSSMCEKWMETYDKLSSEELINEIRHYLFFEKKLHNADVQKQADGLLMSVLSNKYAINQLLEDIKSCDSAERCMEYREYSKDTTFKLANYLLSEIKNHFEAEGTEIVLDKPKEMYMYADVS